MCKRVWLTLGLLLMLAAPAAAQITPTYTFTAGTTINPDDVNANFALLANALNRTGGTMTGTLTSRNILPDGNNTRDVGASGTRFANLFATVANITTLTCTDCVAGTQLANTAVTPASYGNASTIPAFTVDADGRLTAASAATVRITLTGTYLIDLGGSQLTNLDATQVDHGTLPGAVFPATLPAVSGVNLTALNASALASGAVPDARLSTNVALVNVDEVFAANLNWATSAVFSWVAKAIDTVYQAASDGFVVAYADGVAIGGTGTLGVQTDSANPPTTWRARTSVTNNYGSVMVPVKKNDFYRAVTTTTAGTVNFTVFWVPLGTGG
jgi:hypothetical protein